MAGRDAASDVLFGLIWSCIMWIEAAVAHSVRQRGPSMHSERYERAHHLASKSFQGRAPVIAHLVSCRCSEVIKHPPRENAGGLWWRNNRSGRTPQFVLPLPHLTDNRSPLV